jgi:anti-sigma regulatory factor (Ser/Thr protein kinase)
MHWDLLMSLPRESCAPAIARERLLREMPAHGRSDDLLLILSELVTNAVVLGEGKIDAFVEMTDDTLRVAVADARSDMGSRRDDSRGLQLVEAMTRQWGVAQGPDRKIVWAEL